MVLGVPAIAALPDQVTYWSATGVGRTTLPVALAALSMGGHLRFGMEDVPTSPAGSPSNTKHRSNEP